MVTVFPTDGYGCCCCCCWFYYHTVIIVGRVLASFNFKCFCIESTLSTWIICNLENLFSIWSQKLTSHGIPWLRQWWWWRKKLQAKTHTHHHQQNKKISEQLNDEHYEQASYEYFTFLPNDNEFLSSFFVSLFLCFTSLRYMCVCNTMKKYTIVFHIHSIYIVL